MMRPRQTPGILLRGLAPLPVVLYDFIADRIACELGEPSPSF